MLFADLAQNNRILICGVCRNTRPAARRTTRNIEELGKRFSEYRVIIYENNSTDATKEFYREWANNNPNVKFICEDVPSSELSFREANIARARNITLSHARQFCLDKEYKYLVMADLDFNCDWPIDEIIKTIETNDDWDCVCANGLQHNNRFHADRYAFRDKEYPFGPEILGHFFWNNLKTTWFSFDGREGLIPVYSAFGGLAIYKTKSILPFSYSGEVTDDLLKYYKKIELEIDPKNYQLSRIDKLRFIKKKSHKVVKKSACCEHVTLHASMSLNGFGRIYVNPKMYLYY